jgi:hypothetical protein
MRCVLFNEKNAVSFSGKIRIRNHRFRRMEKYPRWLKGLPWKGSRSLIAARGFKSLLLRSAVSTFLPLSGFKKRNLKKVKKGVDNRKKKLYIG